MNPPHPPSAPRLWLAWVLAFYCVWSLLVFGGGRWPVVRDHWPIAISMAAGSYVAGSTPMGGGTVGFPILVLLFDLPASLGRNFSLAVQSVGMVSASIYLIARRQPLDWRLLRCAMAGAAVASPLAAAFVAPFVLDFHVKLLFALLWGSFGLMHLFKVRELAAAQGITRTSYRLDREIGLAVGVAGGITSMITGVGIDMMLYMVLVLLYHADLRIAIPSSVVLMAFTSLLGIAVNVALSWMDPGRYVLDPEVFANWLAAAPVVILGAPFGALVVSRIRREPTLLVVSVLCVAQFFWTCHHEGIRGLALLAASGGLVLLCALFVLAHRLGGRLAAERR